MCNSVQPEKIIHFMGECSILLELRLLYLNSTKLSEKVVILYLNWKALFKF